MAFMVVPITEYFFLGHMSWKSKILHDITHDINAANTLELYGDFLFDLIVYVPSTIFHL